MSILGLFNKQLIATPQGGFMAPNVLDILGRKNLTIFQVCHYSRFYMMISSEKFSENRDKECKLGPMYFNFPCTGNYITNCI